MSALQIRLDQPGVEPGGELTGRAEWDLTTRQADHLVISLLWYTEGKGSEDAELVDEVRIDSPPVSGYHEFRFRLPVEPWSFSGQLISLIWTVEAALEGTDEIAHAPFACAPEGREILLGEVD